jgi:hypothetical protein
MMISYRVFGVTFRSDCDLPGLDPISETSVVDYSLRFNGGSDAFEKLRRQCHYRFHISSRRLKCGQAAVEVFKTKDCRKLLFRFYDGIEFVLDHAREQIWIHGLQGTSLQAAVHHLVFSLPGFLLGRRKSACLHGAAIGQGDSVIALLGKSNSGKSILCAQLAAQAIEVLSDDLVALDVIDRTIKVHPGYPWVSLRPQSLHLLPLDEFSRRALSEWHYLDEPYVTWDLPRSADSSQSTPKNLRAIYLLSPVNDPSCEPAIELVPKRQSLMALIDAANRTRIPNAEFRAEEFTLMALVVAAVPVYELRYHLSVKSSMALTRLLASKTPGQVAA